MYFVKKALKGLFPIIKKLTKKKVILKNLKKPI